MSASPYDSVLSEGEASESDQEKPKEVPESDSVDDPTRKDKKKKHKHKHHKANDDTEEERLRKRLIEKSHDRKRVRSGEKDEEDELFSIQPGADQKRMKDREKEKDRRDEHRVERGDGRGERRDDRRKEERWSGRERVDDRRGYKEDRDKRLPPPPAPPPHARHPLNKYRRSRSRSPVERKRREEERRRDDKERRRTTPKKEERSKREEKDKKEKKSAEKEVREMVEETKLEEPPAPLEDVEMKEDVKSEIEEELPEAFPESSQTEKSKKYSKFDSSPESDAVMESPHFSDDDLEGEGLVKEEEMDEDVSVDLTNALHEELTEEQKARLSPVTRERLEKDWQVRLIARLPVYFPGISGCRNVAEFDCLNRIEEGTFGVVYRAKDKRTDEIVALKRLKMEKERDGFPITSLREVNMLLKAGGHENVVNVKEIVLGSNLDKIFLVMEFVEHDMKALMETMHKNGKNFKIGEVKTLLSQLLSGMEHLHNLWILHRDLKTSNLLLTHKSVLKIGDFGLAREYGDPLKAYTQVVVTLWYRSPELLLGIKKYSTAVDMWSVGCILAEFILLKPIFNGRGEVDQVNKIFMELGTPSERVWKGYDELPGPKQVVFSQHQYNQLRKRFPASVLTDVGFRLLNGLLMYDPEKRLSAAEALGSEWFKEDPQPIEREMFPTWPAKSEMGKKPPPANPPKEKKAEAPQAQSGFMLKFDGPKF